MTTSGQLKQVSAVLAPSQAQALKAETTWFHVFKDMVDSGDMKKIDGSAIKCYLIIKSYTNFATGRAFPGIDTIARAAGLSESQVMRCIKMLAEFGYVSKKKEGRRNVYTLREKVQVKDGDGRPSAVATWDYLPSSVSQAMADLKNVLMTGDLGGASIVHIERLNVQVINGTGNTGLQMNDGNIEKLPREWQEAILKAKSVKKL